MKGAEDLDKLFGPDTNKFASDKAEEQISLKDKFMLLPRPDIYKPFDSLFNILNKKILLESKEDIKVWGDSIDEKLDKCVRDVDIFLSKVVEYKEKITIELKKYYYEGLIKEILYIDIQSYMSSSVWEQYEIVNREDEENKFHYTDYVSEKYSVYQALVKENNKKFILLLTPCMQEMKQQLVFKVKEMKKDKYYLLDLTDEYFEYLKNKD